MQWGYLGLNKASLARVWRAFPRGEEGRGKCSVGMRIWETVVCTMEMWTMLRNAAHGRLGLIRLVLFMCFSNELAGFE